MESNNLGNIQARRNFFKRVKEVALPIFVGFISSIFFSGCQSSLNCKNTCRNECNDACKGTCSTNCGARCNYGCAGTCRGACVRMCNFSCVGVSEHKLG